MTSGREGGSPASENLPSQPPANIHVSMKRGVLCLVPRKKRFRTRNV